MNWTHAEERATAYVMTSSRLASFIVPVVLLGSACSSSSEAPATASPPLADAAASSRLPEGRYSIGCQFAFEAAGAKIFETGTYEGTGSSYELTFHFFVDEGCTAPFVTFMSKGDFVTRPSPKVPGALEFDATWTGRTMRADSDASLPLLNAQCGTPPWSVGQTQEIFARGCAAAGFRPSSECSHDFDLLKIDGNTFSFGQRPADNNMCTPDRRPSAVSQVVWTKAS